MGVSIDEVFNTLQVYLGSLYVNDFNRFGRTWQVNVQGDADFPPADRRPASSSRSATTSGGMVPLGLAADDPRRERPGDGHALQHVSRRPPINGNAGAGRQLGPGDRRRWRGWPTRSCRSRCAPSGPSWPCLQLQTGNTAMCVFVLAVVLVFLVLAAQYESWSLPLAVILVVPMCLLCSIAGVMLAHMDINIFTQIGFVVLVGLACKNAILIVEFAKAQREAGVPRYEATLDACKLRLRPIIMTSFAFILGVVPLVLAEGAGAEMRRTLGTAVFAGMLGVTLFGIFLTPVFYYVIQWFTDLIPKRRRPIGDAAESSVVECLVDRKRRQALTRLARADNHWRTCRHGGLSQWHAWCILAMFARPALDR